MVKLMNILNEVLNTFIVECDVLTDRQFNITDVLDEVRALRKVTIVNNITPEEYPQKDKIEFTRLKIKFVTRENPKLDIAKFKEDMLTSDLSIVTNKQYDKHGDRDYTKVGAPRPDVMVGGKKQSGYKLKGNLPGAKKNVTVEK